jgi:2-haloacid dehalogenase
VEIGSGRFNLWFSLFRYNRAMNRRGFLAVTRFGAAAAIVPGISEFAAATDVEAKVNIFGTKLMKRPKLLFFDVNETLLDLRAMKTSVAHALDGRTDLLPLWFTTMQQYSLVATVGDNDNDFGRLGPLR